MVGKAAMGLRNLWRKARYPDAPALGRRRVLGLLLALGAVRWFGDFGAPDRTGVEVTSGGRRGGRPRPQRPGAEPTATTEPTEEPRNAPAQGPGQWGDPASWPDGRVPGPGDVAVVDRQVFLGGSAAVAGVRIEPGGELILDPAAAAVLHSRGNVVVAGRLSMRPSSASVEHRVTFFDVDESRFVGGHAHEPLDTDVGLWVVGDGIIDLAGQPKRAWTRASGSLEPGQTEILVADAAGWRPGDRLAIAPTIAPTVDNGSFHQDVDHALAYDEAVIAAIDGQRVRLTSPLEHPHPEITVDDWEQRRQTYGAEVLNLTRNAVIEGQDGGRAHIILLHAGQPQQISHTEIRHMGPRQGQGKKTSGVLARYGLHFHMCEDGSRGSVVEGVVIHSGGAQGFVPHDSHGITLRDCVAHDVMAGGFWWDVPERRAAYQPKTHDSLWERCVASKVTAARGGSEGYRLAGFSLSEGSNGSNRCIDCVAVGIARHRATMNSSTSSGFHWTELGRAVWVFSGCLAHNNGGSGSFAWQNDEQVHVIERFTAYHNGRHGIDHGAYSNYWQYRDCALHGNRIAGVGVHAVTRRTNSTPADAPLQTYERLMIDGAGISTYGFTGEGHRFPALDGVPVVVKDSQIRGARVAAFHLPEMRNREEYRVENCTVDGREFLLAEDIAPTSRVEVVNLNGEGDEFVLERRDRGDGRVQPRWNALLRTEL